MNHDPVVILSAKRTPMGAFQGALSAFSAPQLAAEAIRAATSQTQMNQSWWSAHLHQALLGCVLPAGLGQAPARQAVLQAGLPLSVACTTINKVCGSGMQSTILGAQAILAGFADMVLTGGMESMTNAPYMLPKARGGYRLGHGQLLDHMFFDGLEDAYSAENRGRLMGTFAEECASAYHFTREAQDAFAVESTKRAQAAVKEGKFKAEIAPLTHAKGETIMDDEPPAKARLDKIASLKPAFKKDGTVTPANSSSIADGAAALVLAKQSLAERLGIAPLAKIVGFTVHAHAPHLFPTAPVGAMKKLSEKIGWSLGEVDLFEINEAFAVVTMAAMNDLNLPHDKVNIYGGACALGHPIGASGARILVTLLHALKATGGKRGIASLCIGGGEATAMAVEVV